MSDDDMYVWRQWRRTKGFQGGAGGSANVEDGLDGVTLRFLDSGAEMAYVRKKNDLLVRNLRMCCGLLFLSCAASTLAHFYFISESSVCRPWHCGAQATPAQRAWPEAWWMGVATSLVPLSVGAMTKVSCLTRRLGPLGWEVLISGIVIPTMVCPLFLIPSYWGQLKGYSVTDVVGPNYNEDATLVLFIDMVITGSHFLLPIRWFMLIPVQVGGVLVYVVTSLVLHGNAQWLHLALFLTLLSACASFGKRTVERQERLEFKRFMAEKALRLHMEFQLSQAASRERIQCEDQHSMSESMPSTTESGRAFDGSHAHASDIDLGIGLLPAISEVGEKEQWLISPGQVQLQLESVLGEGSFGRVVVGWYCGTPVAVKIPRITARRTPQSFLNALSNELKILRRLRHPNIVFLMGALLDTEHGFLAIVLEVVDGAPLRDFISSKGSCVGGVPTDVDRVAILADISCALWYLHTRQPLIVHGDLKDSNVFVEPNSLVRPCRRAKLLDFGLSRTITKHAKPLGGTLLWMAPEVIQHGTGLMPSTAADVFSFGRLGYFVLTGVHPATLMSHWCIVELAGRGRLPELHWPHEDGPAGSFRGALEDCYEFDPDTRPHIAEVHPPFAAWLGCAGVRGFMRAGASPAQDVVAAAQEGPKRGEAALARRGLAQVLAGAARKGPRGGQAPEPRTSPRGGDGPAEGTPELRADAQPAATYIRVPGYSLTPQEGQLAMLMQVIETWNIEVPQTSCCFYHAGLSHIQRCCEALQKAQCCRLPAVAGQCELCGVLVTEGNDGSSGECDNCGAQHISSPQLERQCVRVVETL